MAKRDKVLPREGEAKDSSEATTEEAPIETFSVSEATTEEAPIETFSVSDTSSDAKGAIESSKDIAKDAKMAELEAIIERQRQRMASLEGEAAEAKERVAALSQAQAQVNRPRSQPMLSSDTLQDRPHAALQVEESTRRKLHANAVRKAVRNELGECDRVICAPNLMQSGRCEVHVTLPDHVRLNTSKDAFVAVFEDGYARVPGGVAEILLAQGRYQQVN